MITRSGLIQWGAWGPDAFDRAATELKPVLLGMGPAWCHWTAEQRADAYDDPEVADLVQARFVPVWVDADARPDVSERYTLGRWPTTAFLTPEGEVLGGGVYLEPATLLAVAGQVAEAYGRRRDELAGAAAATGGVPAPAPTADGVDDGAGDWLETELRAAFDERWAGFGVGPKRVHGDALEAALLRCAPDARDPALAGVVEQTLDAITDGELWDQVDGGFFRFCEGRDWSAPHVEKVTGHNARLLRVLLLACGRLERPDLADRAAALVRFVHRTLADPEGGFYASQRADPAYSALATVEARRGRAAPPVDRTIYTDAAAAMASAYALGADVLDDPSLLEFAATTVDRVVLATYERGAGVGHVGVGAPPVRGLLVDQVAASEAMLDLHEATGQQAWLDMPRELMAYCRQTMWSDRGFEDRARVGLTGADAPVGLLRQPVRPLELTCRAAVVLARLARLTDEPSYAEQARAALASQTPVYRAHGLDGAAYPLALARLREAARNPA